MVEYTVEHNGEIWSFSSKILWAFVHGILEAQKQMPKETEQGEERILKWNIVWVEIYKALKIPDEYHNNLTQVISANYLKELFEPLILAETKVWTAYYTRTMNVIYIETLRMALPLFYGDSNKEDIDLIQPVINKVYELVKSAHLMSDDKIKKAMVQKGFELKERSKHLAELSSKIETNELTATLKISKLSNEIKQLKDEEQKMRSSFSLIAEKTKQIREAEEKMSKSGGAFAESTVISDGAKAIQNILITEKPIPESVVINTGLPIEQALATSELVIKKLQENLGKSENTIKKMFEEIKKDWADEFVDDPTISLEENSAHLMEMWRRFRTKLMEIKNEKELSASAIKTLKAQVADAHYAYHQKQQELNEFQKQAILEYNQAMAHYAAYLTSPQPSGSMEIERPTTDSQIADFIKIITGELGQSKLSDSQVETLKAQLAEMNQQSKIRMDEFVGLRDVLAKGTELLKKSQEKEAELERKLKDEMERSQKLLSELESSKNLGDSVKTQKTLYDSLEAQSSLLKSQLEKSTNEKIETEKSLLETKKRLQETQQKIDEMNEGAEAIKMRLAVENSAFEKELEALMKKDSSFSKIVDQVVKPKKQSPLTSINASAMEEEPTASNSASFRKRIPKFKGFDVDQSSILTDELERMGANFQLKLDVYKQGLSVIKEEHEEEIKKLNESIHQEKKLIEESLVKELQENMEKSAILLSSEIAKVEKFKTLVQEKDILIQEKSLLTQKLGTTNDSVIKKLKESEARIGKLENELKNSLQAKIRAEKDTIEMNNMVKEIQRKSEVNVLEARRKKEELENSFHAIQVEKKKLALEVDSLNRSVAWIDAQKNMLEIEKNNLKNQLAEKEGELNKSRAQIAEKENLLNESVVEIKSNANEEIQKLQRSFQEKEQQVNSLMANNQEKSREIENLKKETEEKQQALEKARNDLSVMETEVRTKFAEMTLSQTQEKERMGEDILDLSVRFETSVKNVKESETKILSLAEQLKIQQEENAKLKQEVSAFIQIKQTLEALENENAELKRTVESLTEELSRMKDETTAKIRNLNLSHDVEKQTLLAQVNEFREKAQQQLNESVMGLESQSTELKKLREELYEKNNELEALKSELSNKSQQIFENAQQFQAKQRELDELRAQSEARIQELQTQLLTAEELKKSFQATINQVTNEFLDLSNFITGGGLTSVNDLETLQAYKHNAGARLTNIKVELEKVVLQRDQVINENLAKEYEKTLIIQQAYAEKNTIIQQKEAEKTIALAKVEGEKSRIINDVSILINQVNQSRVEASRVVGMEVPADPKVEAAIEQLNKTLAGVESKSPILTEIAPIAEIEKNLVLLNEAIVSNTTQNIDVNVVSRTLAVSINNQKKLGEAIIEKDSQLNILRAQAEKIALEAEQKNEKIGLLEKSVVVLKTTLNQSQILLNASGDKSISFSQDISVIKQKNKQLRELGKSLVKLAESKGAIITPNDHQDLKSILEDEEDDEEDDIDARNILKDLN